MHKCQINFGLSLSSQDSYSLGVATKKDFIAFRVPPELKDDIVEIADREARSASQICELLLSEGIEIYKRDGSKFIQRLIAKRKERAK